MNESFLNKVNEAIRSINNSGIYFEDIYSNSELFHLYVAIFGIMPSFFELGDKSYTERLIPVVDAEEDTLPIDVDKTLPKILEVLGNTCVIFNHFDCPFIISEDGMMIYATFNDNIVCLYKENKLPEAITNCVVCREPKKKQMLYVTQSSRGFSVTGMDVNKQDCDISMNYNDDLPDAKIREALMSDESGILILHGIPGCGNLKEYFCILFGNPNIFGYLCSIIIINIKYEKSNTYKRTITIAYPLICGRTIKSNQN